MAPAGRTSAYVDFMLSKVILLSAVGVLWIAAADLDLKKLPPASAKKDVTYAKDIKPLFEKNCFKCHGSEKQKGKLRLDSLEAVKKGGEDGEVVTPGDSKKSMLVQAVSGALEDGMMPPEDKGKPLSKDQI